MKDATYFMPYVLALVGIYFSPTPFIAEAKAAKHGESERQKQQLVSVSRLVADLSVVSGLAVFSFLYADFSIIATIGGALQAPGASLTFDTWYQVGAVVVLLHFAIVLLFYLIFKTGVAADADTYSLPGPGLALSTRSLIRLYRASLLVIPACATAMIRYWILGLSWQ